jgi:hypothetical protein
MTEAGGGWADGREPTGGSPFGDDFVKDATIREPSAAERSDRVARHQREQARLAEIAWRDRMRAAKGRRRPPIRGAALIGIVALVLAGTLVRSLEKSGGSVGLSLDDITGDSHVHLSGGEPPPGVGEQPGPLGHPAAPPSGTGPYTYMAKQAGSSAPVAYDPCRAIHVVINDRTEPPGGDVLVQAALQRASQVSGLVFLIDGHTNEAPSFPRPMYQPKRYGSRWAPVLIDWTDPNEVPRLTGAIAGLGGSELVQLHGTRVYVTGGIWLDGPQLDEVMSWPDGQGETQAVIEHEIGHLLGLDHVKDPTELMNAQGTRGVDDYQAGDQIGLEALGRGHCVPGV